MKLVNAEGTAKEVVVVTQEHFAALVSIATTALKMTSDIDSLIDGGQQVHYVIKLRHELLKLDLKKYGEI